jgi:mevalonate kinase
MKSKLSHKIFHSKILLFGEHIINKGAMGLASPVEHYNGLFKIAKNITDPVIGQSNESLGRMAHYIIHHDKLCRLYDTNQMLEDIERGLYFDSNIPQGYGLGSSGALVAAIYWQYRKNRQKTFDITEVKHELALVESYFHGTSSGLDPIVCLLNQSVIINNGEVSKAFKLPDNKNGRLKLFLLNTHIERKTAPYVNLFLEKCKDAKFLTTIQKSLIPANNIAIESFLGKQYVQLMKSVHIISQLQYDLLPEFIPAPFKQAWREGLKHHEYHLKICGAGGGGFIVGIAKADTNLAVFFKDMELVDLLEF